MGRHTVTDTAAIRPCAIPAWAPRQTTDHESNNRDKYHQRNKTSLKRCQPSSDGGHANAVHQRPSEQFVRASFHHRLSARMIRCSTLPSPNDRVIFRFGNRHDSPVTIVIHQRLFCLRSRYRRPEYFPKSDAWSLSPRHSAIIRFMTAAIQPFGRRFWGVQKRSNGA